MRPKITRVVLIAKSGETLPVQDFVVDEAQPGEFTVFIVNLGDEIVSELAGIRTIPITT